VKILKKKGNEKLGRFKEPRPAFAFVLPSPERR